MTAKRIECPHYCRESPGIVCPPAFFPDLQKNTYGKSRAVAYQGVLFTLAFLSTHLLDMIASILWRTSQMWNLYFDIVAYMVMQLALGILNFLIFSRNRKNMATPEGRFVRRVFFSCACLCGLWNRNDQNSKDPKDKRSSKNSNKNDNHSNTSSESGGASGK